jgi:uncharacterized membrane protein
VRSLINWLFPNAAGPDTEVSLRLNQAPEGAMVFVLVIGVILFAVWIYRRDGKLTASPGLRLFLGVLRAALIAMMIVILAEPVLLATRIETRKSTVIVIVDDSFSMDLGFADVEDGLRKRMQKAMGNVTVAVKNPDGKEEKVDAATLESKHFKTLTRLDVVSAAMRNAENGSFIDALKQRHDVRVFAMSNELSENTDAKTPIDLTALGVSNIRGGKTRIGDCLREALRRTRGQPLAGVVIISDGHQNAGEDAAQAAQSFRAQRVPIFTVGIGDPAEPRDFEVTFEGPDVILPEDKSEGVAMVRYIGYANPGSVTVEMRSGDRLVCSESVKLGKPGEKTPVPLHFSEEKEGAYTYSVKIPIQQGELRNDNNEVSYKFQVVNKKVKVLFVEGQDLPRWEYRYLKNALRRDHTTEVDVLLASSDNTFLWDGSEGKQPLEQFPVNKKEISEYDVIMLGDVSPTIFTKEQIVLLREFVRDGGGFIMIAGERFAPLEYRSQEWAEMLPVVPEASGFVTPEGGYQDENAFQITLTQEGGKMPWTHLDPQDAANREIWEGLPKLYWYYPVQKSKEFATVIAEHPMDKGPGGKKRPLIVTMPYGVGRTMFIAVDSLWRWRKGVGDRYHYRFYSQAIRYLSMAKRIGGQKRFQLGADRAEVPINDKVILTAIVKDADYKNVTTDTVTVHARTPKGEEVSIPLKRLHDRAGSYDGEFYPGMEGEYSVWFKDETQPDTKFSETTFKVKKPELEFENPRLDEELLRNIAKASGEQGEYVFIDGMKSIPPKIISREERIPHDTVLDLWDNWMVFALFTALITAEWLLRKRGKMI